MTEPTGRGPIDGPGEAAPEIEATLAVSSETPAEVADRIAGLDGVGPYRFEWRGSAKLRDVYLDTPAGELGQRGVALRLRREDGGWRITLKGPARPASGGGVERSELEVEWSPDGLRRVLGALRERGVELPGPPPDFGEGEPQAVLRDLGLEVVQERRTLRRGARVVAADDGSRTLAWLALDTVGFRTASGTTVLHREVEIEAAPGAPEGLPGEVAGLLQRTLGDALRPWEHGKLATGAAVEELDPPAGPDGSLRPAAYDLLGRELGGGAGEGG